MPNRHALVKEDEKAKMPYSLQKRGRKRHWAKSTSNNFNPDAQK